MYSLQAMFEASINGNTIGFTCSAFDLFHAGHVAMLAEAKSVCEFLVVGLLTDPTISRPKVKQKPIQSLVERWTQLQGSGYPDLIIPFQIEEEIDEILKLLPREHIRIIGEEYKEPGMLIRARELSKNIYFNQRCHDWSSSSLKERIKNG